MKNENYSKEDKLHLKIIISLSRSRNFLNKRENIVFKKFGLTTSQFGVLELLYHKGICRIKTIIEKTLSTGGNITVVIDNLEKCGFISRLPDPDDRRASLIAITEKGTELIRDAFTEHLQNLNQLLNVLNDDEKKELIRLHKKIGKQIV